MENQRVFNSLTILLSSIVILLFGGIFFQFAINIPKWDDFAFIKFIADFNETDSFLSKFESLFKQHNEHRVVTTRMVALLDYYLFGKLNFVHLMVVGNLGLLLILFIFYKQARKIEILFPLSVLWLNASFYENSFWGMASFQNFWVVFFVVWCIYLIAQNKFSFGFQWFVIPLLAIFTSGNGLVIIPLIACFYLFEKKIHQLILWIGYSILVLFIYFIPYQKPPDAISEGFYLISFIKGVCLFLGSAFDGVFWGGNMLQMVTWIGFLLSGFSIFLSIYFLTKPIKKPNHWFFILISGFVISTALIVAFNRVGQSHANALLVSRYKIYSVLLCSNIIIILYHFALPSRFATYFRVFIVGGSLVYFICIQHYFIGQVVTQKQYLQSFLYNWTQHELSSATTKYYQPPTDQLNLVSIKKSVSDADIKEIKGGLFTHEINLKNDGLNTHLKPFLLIHNKGSAYLIPFHLEAKYGVRALFDYKHYFQPKASLAVDLHNFGLPNGHYYISTNNSDSLWTSIGTVNLITAPQKKVIQNW